MARAVGASSSPRRRGRKERAVARGRGRGGAPIGGGGGGSGLWGSQQKGNGRGAHLEHVVGLGGLGGPKQRRCQRKPNRLWSNEQTGHCVISSGSGDHGRWIKCRPLWEREEGKCEWQFMGLNECGKFLKTRVRVVVMQCKKNPCRKGYIKFDIFRNTKEISESMISS